MNNPKISIITITYNSEKTVRETFDSVRAQHYDNLEYIIVDGGSKDHTLEIAEEYKDIISKIVSEPDEGISDAMNKGIRLATGDLIGIIHSDDMLTDGALETLAAAWDGTTDVYYGNCIVCKENGEKTHILHAKEDLSDMPYSFVIIHPSSFVTKKCYEKWGIFDKSLKCSMDYELMLRFYKSEAKFKYIDKPLAVYREGGTNMKYRNQTIHEVRDISIRHGGSKLKANCILVKKKLRDRMGPIAKKMGLHNTRVQKLTQIL